MSSGGFNICRCRRRPPTHRGENESLTGKPADPIRQHWDRGGQRFSGLNSDGEEDHVHMVQPHLAPQISQ
ncbi:hypothetical protein EYF80_003377 [Liparis tanakae]|uniref:Uncharacterized protein n=1 Tax=Liparis tanakae TaxID=230148 RepID=A0A4Z2JA64_9TELE|nr:hypothetical protein EYF80_003377 [Liparis tanakae]